MHILDTNPLSILERRGAEAAHLAAYLDSLPAEDIYVTVISYEEQIRGWMAALGSVRNAAAQVMPHARLLAQMQNYCRLSVLPFDEKAAAQYNILRAAHRRISSPDLKIAAIVLVNDATLVTQNTRDFQLIADLRLHDWTQ